MFTRLFRFERYQVINLMFYTCCSVVSSGAIVPLCARRRELELVDISALFVLQHEDIDEQKSGVTKPIDTGVPALLLLLLLSSFDFDLLVTFHV